MATLLTQTYNLNLIPGQNIVVVNVSAYDNSPRLIRFNMYNGSAAIDVSAWAARVEGTRQFTDAGFSTTATVSGSTVTFAITNEMTASSGRHHAVVVFYQGEDRVASADFVINVSKAALDESTPATEEDNTLYQQWIAANTAQIQQNATDIAVLSSRMDTFAQLPSGSTSGDAELIDIRVGADGVTYPTAGDAVRGQVNNLNSALFGGRFTLPVVYTSGGYIREYSPGDVVSYSGWNYTDYIDIRNNDGILYCAMIDGNGTPVSDGQNYNAFYNERKEYISNLETLNGTVQIPNGAFYVRLSCRSTYTQQIAVNLTGIENEIPEVDSDYITITTWNVGLFKDGTHRPTEAEAPGQIANFLRTIGKCNADIINMQEYAYYVDSNNTYPSMHLIDFKYPYTRHYTGSGATKTGSKYETSEITKIIFNSGSNRECYYCDINVKGKTITVINAHLSIERDPSAHRNADIAQLIEFMNTRDYVILTGDFNVASDAEFDAFKSAGYTLCNGGVFGWFDTWPVWANMWEGFTTDWPCYHLDNIIVTSNIIPQYVECVESKISDHAPLLAVLKIN